GRAESNVARLSILCYRRPDRARSNGECSDFVHRLRIDFRKPAIDFAATGIAVDSRPDSHIYEFSIGRWKSNVRTPVEIACGNPTYNFVGRRFEKENRQRTAERIEHHVFVTEDLGVMRLASGVDQCCKLERFCINDRSRGSPATGGSRWAGRK